MDQFILHKQLSTVDILTFKNHCIVDFCERDFCRSERFQRSSSTWTVTGHYSQKLDLKKRILFSINYF